MLPELPTIAFPDINIEAIIKVFVYVILGCFVIFSALMWREVVLASRVLKTKATTLVRVIAGSYFLFVIGAGLVTVLLLLVPLD